MIQFIDTHAHLYDEAFDGDLDEVIGKIKGAGVVKCILPAIDSASFARQQEVAVKYGDFTPQAMGLHPTSVGENWKEELDFALSEIDKGGYIAVGEIGVDGYWSRDFIEQQKEAFRVQMEVAYKKNLPVIIHVREATEEVFQVLDSLGGNIPRGVFHAFSGSWETYDRLSRYGDFMVGIGGVVTYKNAGVAKSIENIPLDRIVLETDCPYLTPEPNRGKRNNSLYLPHVVETIAQLKKLDRETVEAVTWDNGVKMYRMV